MRRAVRERTTEGVSSARISQQELVHCLIRAVSYFSTGPRLLCREYDIFFPFFSYIVFHIVAESNDKCCFSNHKALSLITREGERRTRRRAGGENYSQYIP